MAQPPPLDFNVGVVPCKTPAEAGAHFDTWTRLLMAHHGRVELTPAEKRDVARQRHAYVRCCVKLAHNPKTLALLRRQADAAVRMTRGERVTMPAPIVARPVVPATRRVRRPAPRRRRALARSSSRSGDSGDDEPEPPWRRRIAARLALRCADLAGYEAVRRAVRLDMDRERWSS
jgi:hypothetical protein